MICHIQKSAEIQAKSEKIAAFSKYFVHGLAAEVEKGQDATDIDYIAFQRSVNANIKSGPVVRHKVLLRKLFAFDPDFLDAVDSDVAASADYSKEIESISSSIRGLVVALNEIYAAKHGSDLFKPTNKTVAAQEIMGDTICSFDSYKNLIDNLYFIFWEGPGQKIADRPQSFKDINILRTDIQHDVDHGNPKAMQKKKLEHGGCI